MKKRLRKKKHLGEHAERGRRIVITRSRKDGFDDFLDAFVLEAIEGNGCFCGGGGKEERLDARGDIAAHRVGPEYDLWQDDRPEPSSAEGAMVAAQETAR